MRRERNEKNGVAAFFPHYLASDKYGHCATIEFIDGKMVTHSGKNLPVKALANTSYDRSVSEWNKITLQKKNGKPVPAMGSSSRGRFIRAADRATAFEPTDSQTAVNTAFDILEDVSVPNGHGIATCWSIVFDTKNLQIHFKTIAHSEIRMIDLQKLDFSCQSPVKMVDINEKLSGDITDQLKDYSFKLHYDHALRAAKKYGLEMGPEELMKEIRSIEEFPCGSSPMLKNSHSRPERNPDGKGDVVYFRPLKFRATDPVGRLHAVQYLSEPEWPRHALREKKTGIFKKSIESEPDGDNGAVRPTACAASDPERRRTIS